MKRIILDLELQVRMVKASLELIHGWDYEMRIKNFLKAVYVAVDMAEACQVE